MKLKIATCQFSVSGSTNKNARIIQQQMRQAKRARAQVAHFPETCLSGYAGVDLESYKNFDWEYLRNCTIEIMRLARQLKLWVVLGSAHRLTGSHKPHNSLYIISAAGQIVDRYDKMFCTGNPAGTGGDLKHYSPGSRFAAFNISRIKCGALICHDSRYPELYREYKKRGVQLLFQSYHNAARKSKGYNWRTDIWRITTAPAMQTYAATNRFWISANNSTRKESCWPAFFVQPDGTISGRLKRNRPGILISTIDTKQKFYDASMRWRNRAMRGVFHSGTLVKDPRSVNRKSL